MPRFTKLAVQTEFELCCDPAASIYEEVLRTYRMEIFALDGQVDDEGWDTQVSVGTLRVSLARFDVALSLGSDPVLVADAMSGELADIAQLMDSEVQGAGVLAEGIHSACLLVHGIDIRPDLAGTVVEYDAIKAALIGLSTGVSRAFLSLGEDDQTRAALNAAAVRYAPLGFQPVRLGTPPAVAQHGTASVLGVSPGGRNHAPVNLHVAQRGPGLYAAGPGSPHLDLRRPRRPGAYLREPLVERELPPFRGCRIRRGDHRPER